MEFPGSAPEFSLRGKHAARIIGVHDGDTVKCIIKLIDDFYTFNIRVYGIDTPEMTSKDPALKARAVKARDRLIQLLTGRSDIPQFKTKTNVDSFFQLNYTVVDLECMEMDKYGRVLASIGSCADTLVAEGLANRYFGKTKEEF